MPLERPPRVRGEKKDHKKQARNKPQRKFHRFEFALTDKEKQRYERLCRHEKTGFKRMVKKALKAYYEQSDLEDLPAEAENQLDLFCARDLFGEPVPKNKALKKTVSSSKRK